MIFNVYIGKRLGIRRRIIFFKRFPRNFYDKNSQYLKNFVRPRWEHIFADLALEFENYCLQSEKYPLTQQSRKV